MTVAQLLVERVGELERLQHPPLPRAGDARGPLAGIVELQDAARADARFAGRRHVVAEALAAVLHRATAVLAAQHAVAVEDVAFEVVAADAGLGFAPRRDGANAARGVEAVDGLG